MHYPAEKITEANEMLTTGLQEFRQASAETIGEAREKLMREIGKATALMCLLRIEGVPSLEYRYARMRVNENTGYPAPVTDEVVYESEQPVTLKSSSIKHLYYTGFITATAYPSNFPFDPQKVSAGDAIAYRFDVKNITDLRLSDDMIPFEEPVDASPLEKAQ